MLLSLHAAAQQGTGTGNTITPRFAVYFDISDARLNAAARTRLDSVVNYLKQQQDNLKKVELTGYCDSVASNAYNDVLSLKRAETVKNYFIAHGLGDTLIKTVIGLGKRQPVNNNADSMSRAENRRVEIVVQLMVPPRADTAVAVKPVPVVRHVPLYEPDTSVTNPKLDIKNTEVGDVIELKDINFYPNRHLLMKEARSNLQLLLNTMLTYKTLKIEIRGHVCCMPPDAGDSFDQDDGMPDLSLQRAKAIFDYLCQKGVAKDRMTYIGLGAREPKVEEFTDEDKLKNRRVEIKILSK